MEKTTTKQTRYIKKTLILVFLLFSTYCFPAEKSKSDLASNLRSVIFTDYQNFYSIKNFQYVFGEICISGIIANTNLDGNIQDWFQESVKNDRTNQISKIAKPIGNVYEPISIYAGLTLLGSLTRHTSPGAMAYQFASKSLRAIVVGAPSVGFFQIVLGASRPTEGGSKWHPFHDMNSVSGHAFIGAIPFVTISKMVDPVALKTILYAGSAATGLSRINDNKHYFSQVLAGWWFAYLAVNSLDNEKENKIRLCPTFSLNGWKMKLYVSL